MPLDGCEWLVRVLERSLSSAKDGFNVFSSRLMYSGDKCA